MDVSEIVDEDSFRRWLEGLPEGSEAERDEARRWAVVLAHRAAMRVLPVAWESRQDQSLEGYVTELGLLRANITCSVFENSPNDQRKRSVEAAYDAIQFLYSESNEAVATTRAATLAVAADREFTFGASRVAVSYAGADTPEIWSLIGVDAAALMAGRDPQTLPLWKTGSPFASEWSTIRNHPSTQSPGWRFWIDWYDRALTGRPQDWKLLEKIALIDPTDWDKGEDHVNARILQIIRDHRPPPPKLTPEIRAHLDLVLTLRDPSRQSAGYLKRQFEALEQAYRQKVGCPNETPEELEPIVTLGRAFGQIAWLLTNETDKDRLIEQLQAEVAILKANNAALIAAANGPKASSMRDVFAKALGGVAVNAVGGVTAGLVVAMIVANVDFVGGPATAESLEPLAKLLTGPVIDLSPSIPR